MLTADNIYTKKEKNKHFDNKLLLNSNRFTEF